MIWRVFRTPRPWADAGPTPGNPWMDGWIDGWTDGWMGGWMDG